MFNPVSYLNPYLGLGSTCNSIHSFMGAMSHRRSCVHCAAQLRCARLPPPSLGRVKVGLWYMTPEKEKEKEEPPTKRAQVAGLKLGGDLSDVATLGGTAPRVTEVGPQLLSP